MQTQRVQSCCCKILKDPGDENRPRNQHEQRKDVWSGPFSQGRESKGQRQMCQKKLRLAPGVTGKPF